MLIGVAPVAGFVLLMGAAIFFSKLGGASRSTSAVDASAADTPAHVATPTLSTFTVAPAYESARAFQPFTEPTRLRERAPSMPSHTRDDHAAAGPSAFGRLARTPEAETSGPHPQIPRNANLVRWGAALGFAWGMLSFGSWAVITGILLVALAAFFKLVSHTCEAVRDAAIHQPATPTHAADGPAVVANGEQR